MNDELKNIEIEAAKVRLQREQLLLQKEIDKRNGLQSAAGFFGGFFHLLGTIVGFMFSIAIGVFAGGIVGGVIWVLASVFMYFNSANPNWEFMARVGFALGRMPEFMTAAMFIVPIFYFVVIAIKGFFGK